MIEIQDQNHMNTVEISGNILLRLPSIIIKFANLLLFFLARLAFHTLLVNFLFMQKLKKNCFISQSLDIEVSSRVDTILTIYNGEI